MEPLSNTTLIRGSHVRFPTKVNFQKLILSFFFFLFEKQHSIPIGEQIPLFQNHKLHQFRHMTDYKIAKERK